MRGIRARTNVLPPAMHGHKRTPKPAKALARHGINIEPHRQRSQTHKARLTPDVDESLEAMMEVKVDVGVEVVKVHFCCRRAWNQEV